MASTDGDSTYFIRVRGRVLGPYTLKQLNTLRVRGQFSQSNEVSTDSKTWESAATLESVFSASPKGSAKAASDDGDYRNSNSQAGAASATKGGADWYYSIDGRQLGPVPIADLQEMITVGALGLTDLVWKDGMSEWQRVSTIPDLKAIVASNRRSRPKVGRSDNQISSANEELSSHFLDHLLRGLRSLVSESFVTSIGTDSIELGRWAIYLSIGLNTALYLICAVKLNSVDIGLTGAGFAVVALILQFAAVKSCSAINLLVRSSSLRMASPAFLDSLAILCFGGGFVILVANAVVWIRSEQIYFLIVGIALFLGCEQLGIMLLHPRALGITISNRASTGEEAIAIVSFFMMLPLRFVPAVFALGSSLSIVGTVVAFYSVLTIKSGDLEFLRAMQLVGLTMNVPLLCAAFPFVAYVYFVFAYLIVDVIRSIIVVPDKVDQLTLKVTKAADSLINPDEQFQIDETSLIES